MAPALRVEQAPLEPGLSFQYDDVDGLLLLVCALEHGSWVAAVRPSSGKGGWSLHFDAVGARTSDVTLYLDLDAVRTIIEELGAEMAEFREKALRILEIYRRSDP